jgi:hypothetical protein
MKVALCFIVSYENQLNKENIWREWIEPNKDIINVYFHYKDYTLIKSDWIKENALPPNYLTQTDYLHIVPAYLALILYGLNMDKDNQWFCFLTDSCVPIISPLKFRELFFENYFYSFMSWKKAWWNISLVKRANLHYLEPKYHLGNSPWFILNRADGCRCINYFKKNPAIFELICKGDVANESIFAIMLAVQNSLKDVKNENTTATDWSRMTSSTSPHLFKTGDYKDKKFIDDQLKENKYTIFLRKIDKSFPDNVLLEYIKKDDNDKNVIEKRRGRIFWLQNKALFLKYYSMFANFIKSNFLFFVFFGGIYVYKNFCFGHYCVLPTKSYL